MKFNSNKTSDNHFKTDIIGDDGVKLYTTDAFPSKIESIKAAKDWLFWFENAALKKAESIYYILAVPDSWMGSPIEGNPYSGLQVKIGRTKDVRKRVANLKTGTDAQLIVHALEPGNSKREKELHEKFKSDRRQGEWFMCSTAIFKHIMDTWQRNNLLPPEYQQAVLELRERIGIYRAIKEKYGSFDMVNPSINDEWSNKNFIDLVYSNIVRKK